jgi:hypothetical protein
LNFQSISIKIGNVLERSYKWFVDYK